MRNIGSLRPAPSRLSDLLRDEILVHRQNRAILHYEFVIDDNGGDAISVGADDEAVDTVAPRLGPFYSGAVDQNDARLSCRFPGTRSP